MALIRCGINRRESPSFAGMNVKEVREQLKQALRIPDGQIKIMANGAEVDSSYQIRTADEIEFVKPSGTKA